MVGRTRAAPCLLAAFEHLDQGAQASLAPDLPIQGTQNTQIGVVGQEQASCRELLRGNRSNRVKPQLLPFYPSEPLHAELPAPSQPVARPRDLKILK